MIVTLPQRRGVDLTVAAPPSKSYTHRALIAAALAETPASDSLVISISTGLWASDLDHILSRCVEETAVAVLHWLDHVRTPNRA